MDRLNVGVIGCGYWGPKLMRNFSASDRWNLRYACDTDPEPLERVAGIYPAAETTTDIERVLGDDDLDVVAIATPVSTHYDLACMALEAGKHTWVEKPITATSGEASDLIERAREADRLLHVDHTYIYTPAVRRIRELVEAGELGEILYFDSVRVNLGLFQHDINVVWDLAPHDISILHHVVGKEALSVSASGQAHFEYNEQRLENVAYVTVKLADDCIAHFNVNWLTPVKIRQILVGGSEKMLVFNDLEPIEKIKVYDYGIEISSPEEIYQTLIQYRTGDMYSPNLPQHEALRVECEHFADCIDAGTHTDTDGEAGLYVVRILEAADTSLAGEGKSVGLGTT
jgi:predicted dehydrogenase